MTHYAGLFAWLLAGRAALPLPCWPVVLAAGALAAAGKSSLPAALGLAVLATVLGDLVWYEIGRRRGRGVLGLLCRISLEPDSCVRRAEDVFARRGARSLLTSKFVPGLSTVAPTMAGMFLMRRAHFLLLDGAGALIWAGAFLTLGYVTRGETEQLVARAASFGTSLGTILLGGLGLYVAWKCTSRWRLLRMLRMARVSPDELKEKIDGGEAPVIVDLRHAHDFALEPGTIPGALRLAAEELGARHGEIPRDRDVVLYCSCPNETTSAMVALKLRRLGIVRVRPLLGGLEAWRARGFPIAEAVAPELSRPS